MLFWFYVYKGVIWNFFNLLKDFKCVWILWWVRSVWCLIGLMWLMVLLSLRCWFWCWLNLWRRILYCCLFWNLWLICWLMNCSNIVCGVLRIVMYLGRWLSCCWRWLSIVCLICGIFIWNCWLLNLWLILWSRDSSRWFMWFWIMIIWVYILLVMVGVVCGCWRKWIRNWLRWLWLMCWLVFRVISLVMIWMFSVICRWCLIMLLCGVVFLMISIFRVRKNFLSILVLMSWWWLLCCWLVSCWKWLCRKWLYVLIVLDWIWCIRLVVIIMCVVLRLCCGWLIRLCWMILVCVRCWILLRVVLWYRRCWSLWVVSVMCSVLRLSLVVSWLVIWSCMVKIVLNCVCVVFWRISVMWFLSSLSGCCCWSEGNGL